MTRARQKHQQRQARVEAGLPVTPGTSLSRDVFVLDPQRHPDGRYRWPPRDAKHWLRQRRRTVTLRSRP